VVVAIAAVAATVAVAAAEVVAANKFQKAFQDYGRTHSNASAHFYLYRNIFLKSASG